MKNDHNPPRARFLVSIKELYEVMDRVIAAERGPIARVALPPKKDWSAV